MKPGEAPDKHTFDKQQDKIVRTDKFLGENGKTSKAISNIVEIGQQPVLSLGNASGDVGMLEYTLQNNRYPSMAFFVLCDDTERELGDLCFGYRYRIDYLSIGQETFDRYRFVRHLHGKVIVRFGLGRHYLIQLMVNP